MVSTQAVKVSRVKLIERLKQALADYSVAEAQRVAGRLAEHHERLLNSVLKAKEALVSFIDGEDDKYYQPCPNPQLEKAIRLLEMSEEDTITVRATSDVYRYL